MGEAIRQFFGAGDFMPHGMCYLWQPGILTLHVASDALIAAAYFSIPFTLAYFVRKRRDLEFNWMIACFAVFIVACGSTHLLEILTIWHPLYWLSGGVKALTAAASVPTAVLLVKLMPQALRWPSPAALKRANDELQVSNERLVAEAAERRRAEQEIQRVNRAKGRFLAAASHDLRQPLQTLSLLIGSLRRIATNDQALRVVAQQQQAIGSMSRLLNALLDISTLESGTVIPGIQDFDLFALFEELRVEFSGLASDKGLRLEIPNGVAMVKSDPTLLGQILRNLMSNAIRYTHRGIVRVRGERDGDCMRVDIEDSGVGIAEEQLPLIFEEFYQVGVAPYSVREGHGLGLSIVQRVARLLNHELRVRSAPGHGSTFSVSVPVGSQLSPDRTPARPPGNGAAVQRPHVLIVDDDAAVVNATRMLLNVEGFRVSVALSLSEATKLARDHPDIEVLITDFHLGNGETGTAVIDEVRHAVGSQLGAVLVSGDTSTAIKGAGVDARVRVASKPVEADELLALIDSLLRDG